MPARPAGPSVEPVNTTPKVTEAFAVTGRQVTKVYAEGSDQVRALDAVDVRIPTGHLVAIMGPSGSGKSTLMHCLADLDAPTSGHIFLGDTELTGLSDNRLTRVRRDRIGFVFQA